MQCRSYTHVIHFLVLLNSSIAPDARNACRMLQSFAMPKMQYRRACARGVLYGSAERFLDVYNAWLFDAPKRSFMGYSIPQFAKASQYPLMICTALRCCQCLQTLPKNEMACQLSQGQPETVEIFRNLREAPEIISNVKLFKTISGVRFPFTFFIFSKVFEALYARFGFCGPFLEALRSDSVA